MSNRALRYAADDYADTAPAERVWLPAEAPLAMPRQSLDRGRMAPDPLADTPANIGLRRFGLYAATAVLAAAAAFTPFMLYARDGFMALEVVGLCLFLILVTSIACWFCSAVAGFFVMLGRKEEADLAFSKSPPRPRVRTALLMPLYNEDAAASFARLASIDASLAQQGASGAFDIFVLSDTTDDEVAAAEWAQFESFRIRAHSRVYYRRRRENLERKSGNLADWVRRFGAAYPYMVVLDADSTMAGKTLLQLVDGMERHPGAGLIQTTPTIINARTLHARNMQFGVRLYGRVASAGLAWWAGTEASYWGHNAILRTRAFAESAGLPILPGRKPFGGHVMSHDVVEASLIRRAGWGVHVAPSLDGSHEETPPNLVEFMKRERRWCQGNIQHLAVVRSGSLHQISRFHMMVGCMAYVASPLWFASLLVGMAIQLREPVDWGSFLYMFQFSPTPLWWASLATAAMLMGPKVLGTLLVLLRPEERAAFGGGRTVVKGALLEILLSAVMAPVMMVGHTRIVWQVLSGKDSGWTAQARDGGRLTREDAQQSYRTEFTIGFAFLVALGFRPDLFVLFSPIVLPLVFAAPLARLTSREDIGLRLRRAGFLLTPEELATDRAIAPQSHPLPAGVVRLPVGLHGAEDARAAELA